MEEDAAEKIRRDKSDEEDREEERKLMKLCYPRGCPDGRESYMAMLRE